MLPAIGKLPSVHAPIDWCGRGIPPTANIRLWLVSVLIYMAVFKDVMDVACFGSIGVFQRVSVVWGIPKPRILFSPPMFPKTRHIHHTLQYRHQSKPNVGCWRNSPATSINGRMHTRQFPYGKPHQWLCLWHPGFAVYTKKHLYQLYIS